jgi:uncharacterized membrane-anchored protein YhcB (DUF1043 family)
LSHHHNNHHESEKHRKQREKNRRNWLLFMHSETARIQVSIGAPAVQVRNSTKHAKKEPKLWSKQLTSIRNRLDNSRREADDRFNRFAGTEDGGGRGR